MALTSIADYIKLQQDRKNRMLIIAEEVKKIKSSLGTQIYTQIYAATLTYVGFPTQLFSDNLLLLAGLPGLIITAYQKIRLKPLLTELETLQKQYNLTGDEFEKFMSANAKKEKDLLKELKIQGYYLDPITGLLMPIKKPAMLDGVSEATGLPKWLRDNDLNPNLAYLAYPIGGYLGYKLYKKFKRKRRK